MAKRWRIERRLTPAPGMTILVPLGSALLALVFGAVFFTITGQDALQVYATMFHGVFGSRYGITETIVKTIPLALSGLGLALAFRCGTSAAKARSTWGPGEPPG
jgi:ABC-type uncharacterized transport system permease subunit